MHERQQGLILFYTLIMTSLFALLVLSQSQLVLLQLKAANRLLVRHRVFHQLENQVSKLVTTDPEKWHKECLITEHNPDAVITRLRDKDGCTIADKGQEYRYLLEDLGLFPCLQLTENQTVYGTKHWRLTIMAIGYESMNLQVRIASESPDHHCENSPVITINKGIISWRHGI